jgi:asparagine synthetase B (glutamine-hydrolysing)
LGQQERLAGEKNDVFEPDARLFTFAEGTLIISSVNPMKLVTDFQLAKDLAARSEPFFYAHPASPLLFDGVETQDHSKYVIGRRYRGLFDDNDGTYITVSKSKNEETVIDRDSYGAIPLFYSINPPIVSTDIRLLVAIEKPALDFQALAEYLSTSYLTGGKTIYEGVRSLMPTQTITVRDNIVRATAKSIFPDESGMTDQEASRLLENALDNSIADLIQRYPGTVILNLSGGADSTLLLAKMCERDRNKEILTTTYFHEDWRADLNDWEYAEEASAKFGSRHRLLKLNNESFCRAHREMVRRAKNVFHTYAAAFYTQNEVTAGWSGLVPIINGSGPDESIIGTEKVAIQELLSLRALRQDKWVDYLISTIDYIKIPEASIAQMLHGEGGGFVQSRKAIAALLLDAPDFVEFQRRYHAITVLQDHIQELSAAALVLDRSILFPYLTNDIFKIVFSSRFDTLNAGAIYKSVVKRILEKFMRSGFVHRKKIGFQSPSRPYFQSGIGFGRELSRLLARGSGVLNLELVKPSIRHRLDAEIDLKRRYDFLEWTVYNVLLLEEVRGACD